MILHIKKDGDKSIKTYYIDKLYVLSEVITEFMYKASVYPIYHIECEVGHAKYRFAGVHKSSIQFLGFLTGVFIKEVSDV